MSILICGSLAYDTLLTFDGTFDDHLLPDQLHKLSVCFRVPQLRREFGGCAGNIAYSLRLLGGEPLIMATVGADFAPYRAHLNRLGIASSHIREIPDTYTAQCFITSDRADNQITAFHPGAMDFASQNHAHSAQGMRLAIVAPSGHPAAMQFCRELTAMGTPFVFDPGQELPLFSAEELLELTGTASYITLNDYESELLTHRTGLSLAALADRVEALVVTRGGKGSDLYAEGQHWHIPAAPADALTDPTGCGDAYRAGLLFAREQGWDWLAAARLASVVGAIKMGHKGAQNHPLAASDIAQRFTAAYGVDCPLPHP